MNQLFKVCTSCRHSCANDRKFARSDMLWHMLVFQLKELLYSFQDSNKEMPVEVSYNSNYSMHWLMIFWLLFPSEFWMIDKCNSNCYVKSLWPFMTTQVIFKILHLLILWVLYSVILCSISTQFQCNYMMAVGSFNFNCWEKELNLWFSF